MTTIKQLFAVLAAFAETHLEIGQYGHGLIADIDPNKAALYPLMHWEYPSINYAPSGREKSFTMDVVFYGLPPEQEERQEQCLEIYNQCVNLAEDLIGVLKHGWQDESGPILDPELPWGENLQIDSATIDPAILKTKQLLTGCVLRLVLSVPHEYSACDLPMNNQQ